MNMITEFTPWTSLFGGLLIGTAAVLLMLTLGRIAGATGILSGVFFSRARGEREWRLAMIAGMISAPLLTTVLTGNFPSIEVPVSLEALIIGGLVVGVGVTLSNGCTSGHGVCGIARLSPRSIIATLTFMSSTTITVYVTRHLIGG